MKKQIGQTKDVGFQFGLRKTFSISLEKAWDFMFSKKGLNIWLGTLETELELKQAYKTQDGIEGLLRVFKPNSHIRMTWKKRNWENTTTVQVRLIESKTKTTISFHQEKLLDAEQRKEMSKYWNEKMEMITKSIDLILK